MGIGALLFCYLHNTDSLNITRASFPSLPSFLIILEFILRQNFLVFHRRSFLRQVGFRSAKKGILN